MGSGMSVDDERVHILRNRNDGHEYHGGLSDTPNALCTGLNGGYQALGLAVAAGARTVVLLGYDMHYNGKQTHWHKGHEWPVGEQMYTHTYSKFFREVAPLLKERGVRVINATPGSKLDCFERGVVEEVLQCDVPST